MLTFFRRIRKSLVANNNVKKYFFYAIGEILLVVIGILIAINLNNSNQKKITKKERDEKVIKMRNDIYADSINLSSTIEFNKLIISKIDSILVFIDSDMSLDAYKQFRVIFVEANMNYRTTFPNQSVYNELISSGSFSNIEDAEFKERASFFYMLYNHFNKIINRFLDPLLLTEKTLFTEGLLAHKYFLQNKLDADIEKDYQEFKKTFSNDLNKRILENHLYELKDLHNQILFFYNVILNQMVGGLPLKPQK